MRITARSRSREYVGNGVICDPYWYVCGTYPIEDVVGSRGGWDFGFNVGGGVGFGLGESAEFYVEMKYHYVAGPEITSIDAAAPDHRDRLAGGSTNGSYLSAHVRVPVLSEDSHESTHCRRRHSCS